MVADNLIAFRRDAQTGEIKGIYEIVAFQRFGQWYDSRDPADYPLPPGDERAARMWELRRQGLTLNEVGKMFNITGERVRQILEEHKP